jgi:alkylation response protein AidB-like acyl-CoA dehydrogenase
MTMLTTRGSGEAASALVQLVRRRAFEIEMSGRLPPDVAAALRESALLRLLMPRLLGGDGGAWRSAFDAVETVAQADSSTGWSLMIGMVGNMLTGYIGRDEAIELFADSSPPYLAGVFEPRGIGRSDGEAAIFRVSGHWRFATGIHLSDWCCVGAVAPTSSDGKEVRQFVVPTKAVTIHSNWNVIGLSGTGSDDVELDSVEVERRRSFTFDDKPWPDDPFWLIPFFTVAASLMAAAVLGMSKTALEIVLAKGAASGDAIHSFGQNQCLEVEVATAEATIRAARSFVLECMDKIETLGREGTPPSERERALLWLAAIHAARSCGQTLDLLFSGEGASGIRRESPLQQRWRDVRAAAQHVLIARQRLEAVGRVLLGAPADARPFL